MGRPICSYSIEVLTLCLEHLASRVAQSPLVKYSLRPGPSPCPSKNLPENPLKLVALRQQRLLLMVHAVQVQCKSVLTFVAGVCNGCWFGMREALEGCCDGYSSSLPGSWPQSTLPRIRAVGDIENRVNLGASAFRSKNPRYQESIS